MKFNRFKKSGWHLIGLLVTGWLLTSAQMAKAADYFLKVDGIDGPSLNQNHPREFELKSFSWGVSQVGTIQGAGQGKATPQNFVFVVSSNAASPLLFKYSVTGKHLKQAILTCRKSGGDAAVFMKVTLSDVLVSSYKISGAPGASSLPLDEIALSYGKVEMELTAQNPDGSTKPLNKTGWDLKTTEVTNTSFVPTPEAAMKDDMKAAVIGDQVKNKNNDLINQLLNQGIFKQRKQ